MAVPLFMSEVPQPHMILSSTVDGKLSASGTVSRCPARTTRWSRPSSVRAITVCPIRSTRRCAQARRTSSTASAISFSLPETDSMSTSARVSATASFRISGASTCGVSGFGIPVA